ncbi:MAG: Fic family protein [bacterium]
MEENNNLSVEWETIELNIKGSIVNYPLLMVKIWGKQNLVNMLKLTCHINEMANNVKTDYISLTDFTKLDTGTLMKSIISISMNKSFLALIMISYIQAFIDGNKRTARMVCNAILLAHDSYPISFRNTDISHYRKAMILFYEMNNFYELKQLFIGQYEFAGKEYYHIN